MKKAVLGNTTVKGKYSRVMWAGKKGQGRMIAWVEILDESHGQEKAEREIHDIAKQQGYEIVEQEPGTCYKCHGIGKVGKFRKICTNCRGKGLVG